MSKVAEHPLRYVKRQYQGEFEVNLHIKEMIAMLVNEPIKQNLYVKAVKLSDHAYERFQQYIGEQNLASATRTVKEMLSKAVRIGAMLAFDGRINVLYAYQQTAIYLSPDLKTVVTINKCDQLTYRPILRRVKNLDNKEELLNLHMRYLKQIEEKEEQQVQLILEIEQKVRETVDSYAEMLSIVSKGRKRSNGKMIKDLIAEQNLQLKLAGRKLFETKVEKRRIAKSLVSLI